MKPAMKPALAFGATLILALWPIRAQSAALPNLIPGDTTSNAASQDQLDPHAPPAAPAPTLEQVKKATQRGVEFLLKDQNPNGSWGGLKEGTNTFTGDVWGNPETHVSWRVATTGLCVLALLETGESPEAQASADKGIQYLLDNPIIRRPSEWDTMNCWANIYALQALAEACADPRYAQRTELRDRMRAVAAGHAEQLTKCQSANGGWGYLEFDQPRTRRPQWSTSFTTAAAIIAMQDAKRCGIAVDEQTIARAVRAVKQCRLPTGAFTYSVNAIPSPGGAEWIDQIKGSLGRVQVCNLALFMSGEPITPQTFTWGLNQLFENHRWLDNALHKPIPHETYYFNSGYFYLFGHYYASRILLLLPEEDRAQFRAGLQREVMKVQGADGAMWDYPMHAYDKPYGAAFGLMTLQRTLKGPDAPKG